MGKGTYKSPFEAPTSWFNNILNNHVINHGAEARDPAAYRQDPNARLNRRVFTHHHESQGTTEWGDNNARYNMWRERGRQWTQARRYQLYQQHLSPRFQIAAEEHPDRQLMDREIRNIARMRQRQQNDRDARVATKRAYNRNLFR